MGEEERKQKRAVERGVVAVFSKIWEKILTTRIQRSGSDEYIARGVVLVEEWANNCYENIFEREEWRTKDPLILEHFRF